MFTYLTFGATGATFGKNFKIRMDRAKCFLWTPVYESVDDSNLYWETSQKSRKGRIQAAKVKWILLLGPLARASKHPLETDEPSNIFAQCMNCLL